jgi:predicted extracellular nuclease
MRLLRYFCLIGWMILTESAWGQLSYTGGVLSQDFNSLPLADTFDFSDFGVAKGPALLSAAPLSVSGVAGWGIHARVGTQLLFLVGQGDMGTASVYSYGQHAAQDRALGSLGGSGQAANLGWRLTNTTGQTLTQFTISFYAEQWRNGGTASLVGLMGEYRLASTGDIDAGTYTSVTALEAPALSAVGSAFAMNGNSTNNRVERSATVTGLNWAAGQMLILRWRDLDETGADNGVAIDDVIFHAPTLPVLPQVQSLSPAPGSTMVSGSRPVVVTFNQPVTAAASWFEITGSLSGNLAATLSNAGLMRYTLTPSAPWPTGETITVRVVAPQIRNSAAQAMATDYVVNFSTLKDSAMVTRISDIQGTDGYSPLTGAVVTVQGVVVADFQGASPALGGYYLQEEEADVDGQSASSEALWIGNSATNVSVGDVVQVTGTVSESGSLTQLVSLSSVLITGTAALPAVTSVMLPVNNTVGLERYEGMRVSFPQTLSVTSNSGGTGTTDGFSRYGELLLSSDGPLVTPTELIDPNDVPASGTSSSGRSQVAVIHAYERQMELRSLILDDASSAQWPDPTPYLNAQATRRCGDTVSGLAGILTYATGDYRVHPTAAVNFVDANPRPALPPAVNGRLKVAAMNVLNYFTTFGGANDRGASNVTEFERQKAKIISALAALDADVLGLMEIQNTSAASIDLLSALNAAVSDPYAFVPDPVGGYPVAGVAGDYIRCVLLYRPSRVSLFGPCHMDTNTVWSMPNPLRFPQAQVFHEIATGERFVVCVNHWKSKSSSGATGLNVDQNDGQAAFTELRRQQAARLHTWLQGIASLVGDNDLLIMGDLNCNGEEDPLDILRANGWSDQGQRFQLEDYSYRLNGQRGRLDHTFASATMGSQILAHNHWHLNADEPAFYDYNTETKSAAQLLINVGTPFRSSDHDPILVGVSLMPQSTTYAMWQAARVWSSASTAAGDDPDGDGLQNLIEFVLNTDPEVPSAAQLPQVDRVQHELRFEYRQRVKLSGTQIIPEWSEDMASWSAISTASTLQSLGLQTELKRAVISTLGKDRLFLRLRVTGP